MKAIIKKEKTFDTVKVFREIKEEIAKETEKMNFAEFKEYINKNKLQQGKPNQFNRQYAGVFGTSIEAAIIKMLSNYWLYLFLSGVLIGALVAYNQGLHT